MVPTNATRRGVDLGCRRPWQLMTFGHAQQGTARGWRIKLFVSYTNYRDEQRRRTTIARTRSRCCARRCCASRGIVRNQRVDMSVTLTQLSAHGAR